MRTIKTSTLAFATAGGILAALAHNKAYKSASVPFWEGQIVSLVGSAAGAVLASLIDKSKSRPVKRKPRKRLA